MRDHDTTRKTNTQLQHTHPSRKMPRETLTDLPLDLLSLIPYWLLVIEVRHSSVNLCCQRTILEAARASSRDVAQFGRVCKATHATLMRGAEPELKAHARALRREARARMLATRFVPSSHQGYVSDSVWAPPEKTVLTVPLFETQRERERQSVRTAEAFHNAMRYDVTTDAAHDVPGRIEHFNIRKGPRNVRFASSSPTTPTPHVKRTSSATDGMRSQMLCTPPARTGLGLISPRPMAESSSLTTALTPRTAAAAPVRLAGTIL